MGVNTMLQSNLKDLLHSRRISIREFSRMIDYRFDAVRLLHNNELKRIPAELIERVCIELNVTPGDLFTVVKEERE
jgi:DNA-binding Xre family transcriptional regulator